MVNSLIARIHLYTGNTASALTFAQQGLVEGDAPFQSLHSTQSSNLVWQQAGRGRTQYVVAQRCIDFVIADPAEAVRVPFEPITGNDGVTIFQRQIKYPAIDSPIDLISWQENELLLAEIELGNSNSASALDRINKVRASHGLAALAALDQNTLIEERDKELFLTGARLPDQRRFGIFHLPGKWQFLPITERERNINPNF